MPEFQGLRLLNCEMSCVIQAQEQISFRIVRKDFISQGF